jgi:sugar phosphate isomerase/epimerase
VPVSSCGSDSVTIALMSGALADWPLADVAASAAGCGVDAIELTVGPHGHVSLDSLKNKGLADTLATLDAAGVALCGFAATGALGLGHLDLALVARAAADAGATFLRVFPPPFSLSTAPIHQISSTAHALAALAAEAPGVRVLIEMSPGTIVPSPESALRVLDLSGVSAAGVVYDPANLIEEGHLQPAYAVALLSDRIGHVHVKNRSKERIGDSWLVSHASLGEGMVDWAATLAALMSAGYRGAFAIDHLSGAPDASTLCADVDALKGLIARRQPGYVEA